MWNKDLEMVKDKKEDKLEDRNRWSSKGMETASERPW